MARRSNQAGAATGGGIAGRLLGERPLLTLRSGQLDDVVATVVDSVPGHHLEVVADGVVGLAEGATVEASFTRFDDAKYRFSTRVLSAPEGLGSRHRLAWPHEVDREQHRAHVRAHLHAEVTLSAAGPRLVRAAGAPAMAPGWRSATIVDLSGSGAAVVAPVGFEPGQVVLLRGEVPGRQQPIEVDVRAEVVRATTTQRRDGSVGDVAAYGVQFLDLPVVEQDRLVAAVLWRKATALRTAGTSGTAGIEDL